MRSDKVTSTLIDISHNIAAVHAFIGDMTFVVFKDDLKTFYAVVRALEIVSEASRRLPDAMKARHPDVPWRSIRDAGNFYRHCYDNVAASFIWETPRDDLTSLMKVVELNSRPTTTKADRRRKAPSHDRTHQTPEPHQGRHA